MKNFLIIFMVGVIALSLFFVHKKEREYLNWEDPIAGSALPEEPLERAVHMAINPSIELDFKTREEIYEIRRKYVRQYPELAPKKYKPSDVIFGQIVDGKPWWGELGESYYGPGENSIAGMSEESRYVVNPYILVGIGPLRACFGLNRQPVEPKALEMIWESRTKAHVYYDVSRHVDKISSCRLLPGDIKLNMVAYNARDFGYNYLAVDLGQSENIGSFGAAQTPQQIKQFIHWGPSCGHPEWCNNMSPDQPELTMSVPRLPAKAHVKLWKKKPVSIRDPADFTFIIYMM